MSQLTSQRLKKLLADYKVYEDQILPLLKRFHLETNPEIFKVYTNTIGTIICSKKASPRLKLRNLRLLKDTFLTGNIQYIETLPQAIIKQLYDIAIFNHQSNKEGRGSSFFVEGEQKQKIKDYGISYVNFAAQMICSFGKLYPKNREGSPSHYGIAFKQYEQLKAPIAQQQYFTNKQMKQFSQRVNSQRNSHKNTKKENSQHSEINSKMKEQKSQQNSNVHSIAPSQNAEKANLSMSSSIFGEQFMDPYMKQIQKLMPAYQFIVKPKNQREVVAIENGIREKGLKHRSNLRQNIYWVAEISTLASENASKKQPILEKKNKSTKKPTNDDFILEKPAQPVVTHKKQKANHLQQPKKQQTPQTTIKQQQVANSPIKSKHAFRDNQINHLNFIRDQYETRINILHKRIEDLTSLNNQYLTIIMQKQYEIEEYKNNLCKTLPLKSDSDFTQCEARQCYENNEKEKKKLRGMKTEKSLNQLLMKQRVQHQPTKISYQLKKGRTQPQKGLRIQNDENAILYRTQIQSKVKVENNNQKSSLESVMPHLKDYFLPLKPRENPKFRNCCFLCPGEEKQFFQEKGVQMKIKKNQNSQHQIIALNLCHYSVKIKIFSENPQFQVSLPGCTLQPYDKRQFPINGKLTNLNFRFPTFNITLDSGDEQIAFRIPIPLTLMSYTVLSSAQSETHLQSWPESFCSNYLKGDIKKKKSIKSVEFNIGGANHDLKKNFPALKFVQNQKGLIEARGHLGYIHIPEISMEFKITQNKNSCFIETQFQLNNGKPNQSFSKAILQVIMYLLS